MSILQENWDGLDELIKLQLDQYNFIQGNKTICNGVINGNKLIIESQGHEDISRIGIKKIIAEDMVIMGDNIENYPPIHADRLEIFHNLKTSDKIRIQNCEFYGGKLSFYDNADEIFNCKIDAISLSMNPVINYKGCDINVRYLTWHLTNALDVLHYHNSCLNSELMYKDNFGIMWESLISETQQRMHKKQIFAYDLTKYINTQKLFKELCLKPKNLQKFVMDMGYYTLVFIKQYGKYRIKLCR